MERRPSAPSRSAGAAREGGGPTARAADRPRARPGLTRAEDRPPAPWGSFPLVELLILIGIVAFVAGFVSKRPLLVVVGLAVASLGGLELSLREHFTGFRSHSSLLALAPATVAGAVIFFATGGAARALVLPVAGVVWLIGFWLFRRAFARRTGGVGFRR